MTSPDSPDSPDSPEPPPLPDPPDRDGAYDPAPDPAYDAGRAGHGESASASTFDRFAAAAPAASSSTPPPVTQGRVGQAGVVPGGVRCHSCGYDLTGATIGGRCAECGTPITLQFQQGSNLPSSGYAVASLVLGIISLTTMCAYGVPGLLFGVLALFFHRSAIKQIDAGQANVQSRGLATAGFICGLIGTIVGGFLTAFIAVMVVLMLLAP